MPFQCIQVTVQFYSAHTWSQISRPGPEVLAPFVGGGSVNNIILRDSRYEEATSDMKKSHWKRRSHIGLLYYIGRFMYCSLPSTTYDQSTLSCIFHLLFQCYPRICCKEMLTNQFDFNYTHENTSLLFVLYVLRMSTYQSKSLLFKVKVLVFYIYGMLVLVLLQVKAEILCYGRVFNPVEVILRSSRSDRGNIIYAVFQCAFMLRPTHCVSLKQSQLIVLLIIINKVAPNVYEHFSLRLIARFHECRMVKNFRYIRTFSLRLTARFHERRMIKILAENEHLAFVKSSVFSGIQRSKNFLQITQLHKHKHRCTHFPPNRQTEAPLVIPTGNSYRSAFSPFVLGGKCFAYIKSEKLVK